VDNQRNKDFGLKGITPADFIVKTARETEGWGGTIQHVKSGQLCSFDDALEMTLRIQEKLDQVGFPQSATERRCWTSPHPNKRTTQTHSGPRREEMRDKKQKKTVPKGGPTFFIRIHYQQNASWQGSVQWLEGKSTRFFRSHLELILLMQEAVEKSGGAEKGLIFNTWEDKEEIIS
jgi:hypothetical protein